MGGAAPAAVGTGRAAQKPAQPFLLGLIGSPIMSSAAPAMHEAAADALGLSAHYRLIDTPGADQSKLKAMLEGVRLLGFSGVNVTFPYKEAVVPLLDALSPTAAAIGTVNTVVARDGKLTGHNTDSTGFAAAFEAVLGSPGERPIALIGAGGVGRAIAFALAELGQGQRAGRTPRSAHGGARVSQHRSRTRRRGRRHQRHAHRHAAEPRQSDAT